MPTVNSILYEKLPLNGDSRASCCQFLHRAPGNYKAVILLKYMYNHRDITKRFEQWMNLLNEGFELDLPYVLEEQEVRGWRSLKEYKVMHDELIEDYFMTPPPNDVYTGVYQRACQSDFVIYNGKIVIAPYGSGVLSTTGRSSGKKPGKYLPSDGRLLEFKIPTATVTLPSKLNPEHNGFKYISWYMVRFFLSYLHMSTFMVENREELEKIIEEFDITWYNMLFSLFRITTTSHFGCMTSTKITRAKIEAAMEDKAVKMVASRDYEFDYEDDYIDVQGAIKSKYGDSSLASQVKTLPLDFFTDNHKGRYSPEEAARVLNYIKNYFKLIHSK